VMCDLATLSFDCLMLRLLPRPALFPYTTLFRSTITEIVDRVRIHSRARLLPRNTAVEAITCRHPMRRLSPTSTPAAMRVAISSRSEEHTSELQSRFDLVCRLLLEKKNQKRQVQP